MMYFVLASLSALDLHVRMNNRKTYAMQPFLSWNTNFHSHIDTAFGGRTPFWCPGILLLTSRSVPCTHLARSCACVGRTRSCYTWLRTSWSTCTCKHYAWSRSNVRSLCFLVASSRWESRKSTRRNNTRPDIHLESGVQFVYFCVVLCVVYMHIII